MSMGQCPSCGAPMKMLFMSAACAAECDVKPAPTLSNDLTDWQQRLDALCQGLVLKIEEVWEFMVSCEIKSGRFQGWRVAVEKSAILNGTAFRDILAANPDILDP